MVLYDKDGKVIKVCSYGSEGGEDLRKKFKREGRFWVYIVECCDGTYYTGYTPDVEKRLVLHNNGKGAKYTKDRLPVKLVWHKEYRYFKRAFLEEKRIKGLTRERKEKLVSENAR